MENVEYSKSSKDVAQGHVAHIILTPTAIYTPIYVGFASAEKSDKFNGTTFKRWKQKILFYLTTLDFTMLLNKTPPGLNEEHNGRQEVNVFYAWKHGYFLGLNYI